MKRRTPAVNQFTYKSFYRRNLPHIQPVTATLFVTSRIADSLPKQVLVRMAEERRALEQHLKNGDATTQSRFRQLARRHFATLEAWLDKPACGPTWLADERVASILAEALQFRDGKCIRLNAYCIMPNHVHVVFAPLTKDSEPHSLSSIMHSLKRNTARRANEVLNRSGSFWAHESFDHYVRRKGELNRIIRYVLENPVKAGLARNWREWRWSFVKDSLTPRDAN